MNLRNLKIQIFFVMIVLFGVLIVIFHSGVQNEQYNSTICHGNLSVKNTIVNELEKSNIKYSYKDEGCIYYSQDMEQRVEEILLTIGSTGLLGIRTLHFSDSKLMTLLIERIKNSGVAYNLYMIEGQERIQLKESEEERWRNIVNEIRNMADE